MAECRSCGEQIQFGITAKGRRMPLDLADRTDPAKANLTVVGEKTVMVPGGEVEACPEVRVVKQGEGTRISHFADCPGAKKHRRPR